MDKVIVKTGCIIALAIAALMLTVDADAQEDMIPGMVCIPEKVLPQIKAEGYDNGYVAGYRVGAYETAQDILDLFAEKCTKVGTELELTNDIVVVCK